MTNLFQQNHLIQSFNRAAATYATAVDLTQEIGQRLLERLDLMRLQPQTIVELGCATGHVSTLLTQRYPDAQVFGIDLAINMLLQAKQTTTALANKLHFICADANVLPFATQSIDFIFSNLMFAWCLPLEALLAELKRILKPQGLLLFTTLGPDTLIELKNCWTSVDNKHSHIHPFLDMHDIGDSLLHAKFLDPVMDMEKLTIHYALLQTLFTDLKNLGMHNTSSQRTQGLTTPRQLALVKENYESYRNSLGKLPATFEVIFGNAWSHDLSESSVNSQNEVIIPITKIKRKHI